MAVEKRSNYLMTFMESEAWRQPEGSWLDKSESMQDPADVIEKLENEINLIKQEN